MKKKILSVGVEPDLESRLRTMLAPSADLLSWSADGVGHDSAALLLVDGASDFEGATRWVKAFQEARHTRERVPVVFCLPAGADLDPLQLAALGIARILKRPLEPREVVRHLCTVLNVPVPSVPMVRRSLERVGIPAQLPPVSRTGLVNAVKTLLVAAEAAAAGNLSTLQRQQAQAEARALTSSFSQRAWDEATRNARVLQLLFEKGDGLSQEHRERARSCARKLLSLVEGDEQQLVPQPGPSANQVTMLVVGPKADPWPRIAIEAAARSFRTLLAENANLGEDLLQRESVDIVLVDLQSESCRKVLASPHRQSVPVVGLLGKADWQLRAQLATSGVTRFVQESQSPSEILDVVQEVEDQARRLAPRILAVGADAPGLAEIEAELTPERLRFYGLTEPSRFWDSLETVAPDIILLSVHLPMMSGLELCRAVRTDPEWAHLPIVFLGARDDHGEMELVYKAGADDYVEWPPRGNELAIKVVNRLLRAQAFRRLSEVDSLTGVATRRRCLEMLKQMLRLASRRNEPVTLAVLDIDHFKKVNDTYGHAVGDDVLRTVGHLLMRAFRTEDVVGRWGGEEFLVGLYTMDEHRASDRLAGVLAQVRAQKFYSGDGTLFHATVSVGLAVYPTDGQELTALFRAADSALYQAKEGGRDRLVVYDASASNEQQRIDLVVVDPDSVLADVILEALETRGYNVRYFSSAAEAREALAGPTPAMRTRALVLEEKLPDSSGLDLLEELRTGTPGFESVRTLFLSGRQSEEQILRGLDLGVTEHLVKPISFAVLIRRLERALGK